jgi:hypothetical protein
MVWLPYGNKKRMRWQAQHGPVLCQVVVAKELKRLKLNSGPYALLRVLVDGKVIWRQTLKSPIDAMKICEAKAMQYTELTKEKMDAVTADA